MIDQIYNIIPFLSSWKFIFIVLITVNIWILFTIKREKVWIFRNLSKKDINLVIKSIKNMNSREFELFIGFLFELKGHQVIVTQATNDYGVDVLVDNYTFIECKHWNKNSIGREIISKLVGSAYALSTTKKFNTLIITTGQYNKNAINYAKLTHTTLWDIHDIVKMIKELDTTEILKYLGYDREMWETKDVKN